MLPVEKPYLFFEDEQSLLAWLLSCRSPAAWHRPWTCVHLEGEGQRAYALTTEGLEELALGIEPLRPKRTQEGEWLVEGERRYRPVRERRVERLLHVLLPRPAKEWRPPSTLYLWVKEEALYRQVIHHNLLLGNDRIRVARILGKGREEYLLEVQRPSPFLLGKWQETPGLELYHLPVPMGRLLVPWGYEFPLASRWGEEEERGVWWVVNAQGEWFSLQGESLRHLYELLQVDREAFEWEERLLFPDVPPFVIRPQLVPSEHTPSASLWLLPLERREVLEALLGEAPEALLAQWMAAIVEEASGQGWYLLWDRRGEGWAGLGELPGRGYYPCLEKLLLFLPEGMRLSPTVSPRVLVERLGLNERTLVLLDKGGEGRLRAWSIPRSALRPAREILDYLLVEHVEELRALKERIEFAYEDTSLSRERASAERALSSARRPWWERWLRRWLQGEEG